MPTIEYRGQNIKTKEHTYRVTVSGGYDTDDKQLRLRRSFKYPDTMTEKSRLSAVKKDAGNLENDYMNGKVTTAKDLKLRELAEDFLNNHCRGRLSPTTVTSYDDMLRIRILPALGNKRVSQIRPADIIKFIRNLEVYGKTKEGNKALSARTIRNHLNCLSSMLQQAVYWQIIPYNPCERVRPPKAPKTEQKFLTDIQVLTLLDAIRNEPVKYQAICQIAIFSGMRRGEIVGLHWDDVNFENRTISVSRTRKYLKGIGYTDKDTKTDSANRTNTVPNCIFSLLAMLKLEQNAKRKELQNLWVESPHVFKQWNGAAMSDDAPYHWLKKTIAKIRHEQKEKALKSEISIMEKELFPNIRLHDLRHTSASLLMAEGVDIQTIRKRLGHAQASTTLNMYGHTLDERDIKASEKLESLLHKSS